MNKKILSFSAIAAILGSVATPLFAGNFFDTYGYSNFTPGGKYKIKDASGNVVGTAYATPSFTFRFKTGNSVEPIFRASPPVIQAGCNGLNIKGMFVSIINLDRLSQMLKNSGASLAWGVLVGLIYSLPGVAATFRNLNQWAKMIQQLMQNACKSGIAIGQMIANKTHLDQYAGKDLSLIPSPQELIAGSDNPEKVKKDVFGIKGLSFDTNTMALSFDGDSGVTPAQSLKAWFKALSRAYYVPTYNGFIASSIIGKMKANYRKNVFNGIINDSSNKLFGIGLMCISFDDTFSASQCKTENVDSNKTSVYLLNGESNDFKNSFSSDNDKYNALMQIWTLGVIANFGYDQYVTPISALKTQEAITKAYKANLGIENVNQNNSKFLKNVIDGTLGAVTTVPIVRPNANEDIINLAKNLAEVMYLGATKETVVDANATTLNAAVRVEPLDLDSSKITQMKAPIFTIVGMENPIESGERMYYILFSGLSTGNAPFVSISDIAQDFKEGAYTNSYKLIVDMIKNGINTTLTNTSRYFIVPGITKKISILQKLPDGPERNKHIAMLAKYNAYYATKSFIEHVFDAGSNFKSYPPVYYTDSSTNAPTPFGKYQGLTPPKDTLLGFNTFKTVNAQILAKAKKAGLKKLNDLVGNDIPTPMEIDKAFYILEKKIREATLKKVAK